MTPTRDPLVWIAQHLQDHDSMGSPGPRSSEPCGSNLSEQTDSTLPLYLWQAHGKALNVDFFGLLIALDLECIAFPKHEVKKEKQKISL